MNRSRSLAILAVILVFGMYGFTQAPVSNTQHPGQFDVRDFGAKGDGTTLDTLAINSAIVAANKAGGGTVVFVPGTYVSGRIRILSNVTLDVEAGAKILGSAKMADYGPAPDMVYGGAYESDAKGMSTMVGLIYAVDAENIGIVGHGIIDGNSDSFFDFNKSHWAEDFDAKYTRQGAAFRDAITKTIDGPNDILDIGRPGNMIILSHAKNVLLRDITLRHSPTWTLHLQTVQGAVIDGIHIQNDMRVPNNDGIDCFACKNVRISNTDIKTADDGFVIVYGDDITATNCTVTSNSSAIRLEDTRNSSFTNLTMHANRGIGVYDRGKGRTDSVLFADSTIDTHLLTGHWWGKGEAIFVAVGHAIGETGSISRVRFSNIVADSENGIQIQGDPKGTISDIWFDNVSLRMRIPRPQVNAAVGGNFDLRWTAATDDFKNAIYTHDIPGFYARYVDGLDLHGLDIQWADGMPAFYSSALQIEDVQNLSIDRFRGRQATAGSANPVIDLNRVKGVSIRDSSTLEGASTFLSTRDVSGERLFEGNDLSNAAQPFNVKPSFTMIGNLIPAKKN
jgi:hypothetical protein